ncbi:dethiobiotin synthase [soil metagenome]
MKQGYFITGTGTGVGKTFVTTALARRGREHGLRVFAFKPIETGCAAGTMGEDQRILSQAAGGWQTGDLAGVYQFELPAAPAVAAPSGAISFERITAALRLGSAEADLVVVEGAGGWRVPIDARHDMGALANQCGFPILVVATAALGTINHSLLTIEAIERDGQRVAGLILSQLPADDESLVATNVEQLRLRWGGPVAVLAADASVLDPLL